MLHRWDGCYIWGLEWAQIAVFTGVLARFADSADGWLGCDDLRGLNGLFLLSWRGVTCWLNERLTDNKPRLTVFAVNRGLFGLHFTRENCVIFCLGLVLGSVLGSVFLHKLTRFQRGLQPKHGQFLAHYARFVGQTAHFFAVLRGSFFLFWRYVRQLTESA